MSDETAAAWEPVLNAIIDVRDNYPRTHDDAPSAAVAEAVFAAIYDTGFVIVPQSAVRP